MKHIILLSLLMMGLIACHRPMHIVEANSEAITVDSTLDAIQDTAYLQYIIPIKEELEQKLNIPIGYAPEMMTV